MFVLRTGRYMVVLLRRLSLSTPRVKAQINKLAPLQPVPGCMLELGGVPSGSFATVAMREYV